MNSEKLKEGLVSHIKWLNNEPGGVKLDLNHANLSYADLIGANLSRADLSYANLSGANLSYANLSYANLSYANLSYANLIGANLIGANLNDANLRGTNLIGADLNGSNLNGANLIGANLKGANLNGADLNGANLNGAKLTGAKLNGAINIVEIVKVENLFTKILAASESGMELDMSTWHDESCKTTHCIAGFAIHLAGEAGYLAERLLGPSCAGALIITQSCEYLNGKVPNFTASNDEGMAFIKECAEKEEKSICGATK